jgi:hypothetical protein
MSSLSLRYASIPTFMFVICRKVTVESARITELADGKADPLRVFLNLWSQCPKAFRKLLAFRCAAERHISVGHRLLNASATTGNVELNMVLI